jgi:hypothetical protein
MPTTQNPLNVTLRKPFYGILPANGMTAFVVSPPMGLQETILCAATRPGEVTFTTPRPDAIVVTSKSQVPIAFGVMIVPTNVVGPSNPFLQAIADRVRALFLRLRG